MEIYGLFNKLIWKDSPGGKNIYIKQNFNATNELFGLNSISRAEDILNPDNCLLYLALFFKYNFAFLRTTLKGGESSRVLPNI